jgi:hypothetical protein
MIVEDVGLAITTLHQPFPDVKHVINGSLARFFGIVLLNRFGLGDMVFRRLHFDVGKADGILDEIQE